MLPNVSGQKLRRGDALAGVTVTSGATAVIGMSTEKRKRGAPYITATKVATCLC
jgi:hypothetical protein